MIKWYKEGETIFGEYYLFWDQNIGAFFIVNSDKVPVNTVAGFVYTDYGKGLSLRLYDDINESLAQEVGIALNGDNKINILNQEEFLVKQELTPQPKSKWWSKKISEDERFLDWDDETKEIWVVDGNGNQLYPIAIFGGSTITLSPSLSEDDAAALGIEWDNKCTRVV